MKEQESSAVVRPAVSLLAQIRCAGDSGVRGPHALTEAFGKCGWAAAQAWNRSAGLVVVFRPGI